MPSEKRARQRAMRELKVAEQTRRSVRVRRFRRTGTLVVVAGVIVGVIFLVSGSSKPKPKAASSATTTTTIASSTTTTSTATTASAVGCPPVGGAAKRVISFTKAADCTSPKAVYDATVKTDVGTFVIKMNAASSPAAVNNFVFLARYDYYDGIIFHRVIPGFVVQGGDPTGTGSGGPGFTWTGNTPPSSCASSNSCYPLGAVAMANTTGPSTNGSQFFIVVGKAGEDLPPNYTLFGQVVSGMSVVNKIAADGTSGGTPKVTHHMVSVTIAQVPS